MGSGEWGMGKHPVTHQANSRRNTLAVSLARPGLVGKATCLQPLSPNAPHTNSQLPVMAFEFRKLAVPASCLVILFFGYSPQVLFYYLEPGPLTRKESIIFNCLVGCIWWTYERSCRVDPGRLPKALKAEESDGQLDQVREKGAKRMCRKCHAVKPPRSHHCKQCQR